MSLTIRRARPDEAGLVFSLVRELADSEKLLHEVHASEADIAETAAAFGSYGVQDPPSKSAKKIAST